MLKESHSYLNSKISYLFDRTVMFRTIGHLFSFLEAVSLT